VTGWARWVARLLGVGLVGAGLLGAPPARALEARYDVELVGITDEEADDLVRATSRLIAEAGRPPPTEQALRRRIEDDLPRIEDAMAALGYWGAVADYRIDPGAEGVSHVVIAIAEGERYRMADYAVMGSNPGFADGTIRLQAADLGLARGSIARSAAVEDSSTRILVALARQGYPLAAIEDRRIVVDHAQRTMSVTVRVATGPFARFGTTRIEGLETIEPRIIATRIAWRPGEVYDLGKVEATRDALLDMALFATVAIEPHGALDGQGRLPMVIRLVEAKQRSIGVGAAWSTSEGFLGHLTWEHRNLMGAAEDLTLAATAGEKVQGLTADLRIPGRVQRRVTWLDSARAIREDQDAYDANTAALYFGAEYAFSGTLIGTIGAAFELSDIDDEGDRRTFGLIGVPMTLARDTTNDLLDPRQGFRLNLDLTPFAEVRGPAPGFAILQLGGSVYRALDTDGDAIVALWGRVGTIGGVSFGDIPANKRFYAGGANSVRAFGFQDLGGDDEFGESDGGRSLIEGGIELRARISETIGVVAFVEGGAVDQGPVPDPTEEFLWGPGIGARYFTDFGPIRADLAIPINPRDDDDDFQFYVGIGQAF
jgi:translocation and assembly module TamA